MFKTILAASDGSAVSEPAFRAAVDLAHAFGGRVRVLSVIPLPASPLDAMPIAAEDERAWVENALADLVRSVPADRCPVESELAFGIPAAVVLDRAAGCGADHIVLGRTGKGAVQRFLLGCVSREVVDRAKIGVTLVA